MSRKGNPYDNAACESFMKTLKYEEVHRQEYRDLAEARASIEHFLERVYNQKRLHSALGYHVRRWSSSERCGYAQRWCRDETLHCSRFLRHHGIFRSGCGDPNRQKLGPGFLCRLPLVGPGPSQRTRRKDRALLIVHDEFRPAIPRSGCSPAGPVSASHLHWQVHPKTVPGWSTMNLQRTANSVLTVCLSQGDNRKAVLPFFDHYQ